MWNIFCFLQSLFLYVEEFRGRWVGWLSTWKCRFQSGPALVWFYFRFTAGSDQPGVENNKFLTFWFFDVDHIRARSWPCSCFSCFDSKQTVIRLGKLRSALWSLTGSELSFSLPSHIQQSAFLNGIFYYCKQQSLGTNHEMVFESDK